MMSEDGIGACGDRGARHLALVVGDDGAHEVDAPVMRDQHHVGQLPRGADVRLHRGEVARMRPGVDARRRAGLVVFDLFVQRVRAHRRATGTTASAQ